MSFFLYILCITSLQCLPSVPKNDHCSRVADESDHRHGDRPKELANKPVLLTSPGSHFDHLHRIDGHEVHKEWKYVLQQQSALNDKVTWTMVYSH